jgi:hypothetical protein
MGLQIVLISEVFVESPLIEEALSTARKGTLERRPLFNWQVNLLVLIAVVLLRKPFIAIGAFKPIQLSI